MQVNITENINQIFDYKNDYVNNYQIFDYLMWQNCRKYLSNIWLYNMTKLQTIVTK